MTDNIQNGEGVEVRKAAIYIAARFSQRPECHALAQALKAQGHTITSRWVKPDQDHVLPTGLSQQAEDGERRRFAMEDCDDVRACDWVVSLQGEPRSGGRGGRHVEFGYGLALGKRMISIGPRETVFHHMDQVEQFDTAGDFLTWSARHSLAREPATADVERVANDYAEAGRVAFDACRDRFIRVEQCYPIIDALVAAGFIASAAPSSEPAIAEGERLKAVLAALKNLEIKDVHTGYDNGAGGGNFIYEDYIPARDALDIVETALAQSSTPPASKGVGA